MLIEIRILWPKTFVLTHIVLLKMIFLPSALHVVIKSLIILFMKFFGFVCDEAGLVLGLNHEAWLIARILLMVMI
jgi:hypothetical protein